MAAADMVSAAADTVAAAAVDMASAAAVAADMASAAADEEAPLAGEDSYVARGVGTICWGLSLGFRAYLVTGRDLLSGASVTVLAVSTLHVALHRGLPQRFAK